MMVCSGTLAPDPSACDVRRRGDVVANALWRSQESRQQNNHLSIFPTKTIDHGESRVLSTAGKRYQSSTGVYWGSDNC